MAHAQRIEGTEIAWTGNRRNRLGAARTALSVGRYLPHREKGLDIVIHPLQRRLGDPDACRLLCADRLETMAPMGVPARGDWHELDCHLRHELDYGEFLWQSRRSPPGMGAVGDHRTDLPARAPRLYRDFDLLVHPVVDVPPEDFLKDLSHGCWLSLDRNGLA